MTLSNSLRTVCLSLSGLCLSGLIAAEETTVTAEAQQALAEIIIPDITRFKQHYDDSIYSTLWNDANNQRFRDLFHLQLTQAFTDFKNRDGIDAELILSQLQNAGARLLHVDSSDPSMSEFQAYVTFDEQGAEELMRLPALDDAPMLEVAGADEAFISENGQAALARFGNTIVFSDPQNISIPSKPVGIESDLEINFSAKAFNDVMLDLLYTQAPRAPKINKDDVKVYLSQFDQFTHSATLIKTGILEEIFFIGPEKSGTHKVDQAILKRIPGNALLAVAFGVNGKNFWREQLLSIIDIAAQENPNKSGADIIQSVNNGLSLMGIDVTLASVFEEIEGTGFMCVTPSAPYPAVTIGMPRSTGLDSLIEAILLARFNIIRPPEGSIESINTRPGVPPIQLGLGTDYWIISTDKVLTQNWLANKTSGWNESPSGKAVLSKNTTDAFVIGAMDTKQLVNIGRSLLGIAAFAAKGDDLENLNAILRLLQKLQSLVEPGYIIGKQTGKDYSVELSSITGSLPLFAAPGAAIMQQQKQRRQAAWLDAQKRQEQIRQEEAAKTPDAIDEL